MNRKTLESYQQRIEKVVLYIQSNLERDLDVNQLAEVACFSPYHFHRIYRQMMQETVNNTVRRLRLQQAASELIRSEASINRVATQFGYGSAEAFSRVFTKHYGLNPAAYRSQNKEQVELIQQQSSATQMIQAMEFTNMFDVQIETTEGLSLIGYDHQGDYMQVGDKFEQLFLYANTKELLNENTRSIGIYYDDPKSVEENDLRSTACISVADGFSLQGHDAELVAKQIPSGQCATLIFKGPYAELEQAYDWFFGSWLPNSNHEAADHPPFEEYLNDPKSTPPSELLTKIYCLLAN